VKGRAIKWLGECSTGYADPSSNYLYATEPTYKTGIHPVRFESLLAGTQYKIWIQIDSKVGQDNLDWQLVGCFFTMDSGEGGEDPQIGL